MARIISNLGDGVAWTVILLPLGLGAICLGIPALIKTMEFVSWVFGA